MVGNIILITWLCGILPAFAIVARYAYDDFTYSDSRDGEAMVMGALLGLIGGALWPVLAVGGLIWALFHMGMFDIIFIRPDKRQQIRLKQRDDKIRAMQREIERLESEAKAPVEIVMGSTRERVWP